MMRKNCAVPRSSPVVRSMSHAPIAADASARARISSPSWNAARGVGARPITQLRYSFVPSRHCYKQRPAHEMAEAALTAN